MEKTFLTISTWWGLSSKPGKKQIRVNDAGNFVAQTIYSLPKDSRDNHEEVGKIDEDTLTKLKDFLEKNVTKDTTNRIFDAGYKIEYKNAERVITATDDYELWKKIIVIAPTLK